MGAYGVHMFKPQNPIYKDVCLFILSSLFYAFDYDVRLRRCCVYVMKVWQTASIYHLVHTAAVLAAPLTKHPNIVCLLDC